MASSDSSLLWTDDWLNQARLRTDPLADQVIADIMAEKGSDEAKMLFDLLINHIELPMDELPAQARTFFEKTGQLPNWTDHQQLKVAEEVFLDHGPKFLVFLYYLSLPTLYACKNGAQVLYQTGRLARKPDGHKQFTRRVAETGKFLLDVMSPDGLQEGGKGMVAAQKVRLIHASIRHFIPADHWKETEWGKPINQEDLAITLMTFSISMLEGMAATRLQITDVEAEAYLHAWKVIGHTMGIEPALLPDNVKQGKELLYKILNRQKGSSEAGSILTQALINFAEDLIPGMLFDNAPEIMIRHLNGKEISEMLGVKPRLGCLFIGLPKFLKKWLKLIETLEDISEPIELLMAKMSKQMAERFVKYFDEYKGSAYRIQPRVRNRWGI